MIKLRTKENATDLAYFYSLDAAESLGTFSLWFAQMLSLDELTASEIELINSFGRNSEGTGSTEISVEVAKNNLVDSIREFHADIIHVSIFYKSISIMLCINRTERTLSIGTNKAQKSTLDELGEVLTTIDTKGDVEMTDDVRDTAVEDSVPSEASDQAQQIPEEEAADQSELLAKLDALQQAVDGLQQSFDDKIAEDAHKNGLFDNMHRELIRYQNGALDKIVDTVALDIIQLVDSTKGHVRVYEKKEVNEENYKKLLRVVKGIAEDLEDILYRQNIESYRVPGHEVDTRRQKIIQTVPTDDESKDNLIAVRVADGYEKGDKVLRPERIKIFKYEANPENNTEN